MIQLRTVQHSYQLWPEVTKRQSPLQLDINNIIRYICHLGILQTWRDGHMVVQSYQSRFYQYQKVSTYSRSCRCLINKFLIAKRKYRQTIPFQRFCRQMYHSCLAKVFEPLKAGMVTPEVIRCPDGHWRRVIYGLGPYIADYQEQVWLAGIVQGWCPKYATFVDFRQQH